MHDFVDHNLLGSLKLQAWFLGAVTAMLLIISVPV